MLHARPPAVSTARPQPLSPVGGDGSASLLEGLDLVQIFAVLRRNLRRIVLWSLAGLALALAYSVVADPKYTAQVSLLLGNRQLRAVQDITEQTSPFIDNALVDSQIEVLDSERVLLSAIRSLRLTSDPEFVEDSPLAPVTRFISRATNPAAWFREGVPSDPAYRLERVALGRLLGSMKITRVGKSNVVNLAVTTKDGRKSAAIANGIADAYLADQLASRFDAAKRATVWFQARIDELRDQSSAAQTAVETFRNSNNLLVAGGQLVSDQQFSQVNADLAAARADRVRKEARYDSLRSVIESGRPDALVTEALENSVVSQLRTRAAEATRRLSEIAPRLSPQHESVQGLRKQIAEYERLIFVELKRIESTYRSDYEAALERERSLERNSSQVATLTVTANAALVQLRQLEQESASLKALHQTMLQRYQETLQQGSFPINDVRVVSDAARPLGPSEPRTGLLAVLGLLFGAGVGVGFAALRELTDRAFRHPQQVEAELRLPVFGVLPRLGARGEIVAAPRRRRAVGDVPARDAGRHTIVHPTSSYAESLRAVKVALDNRFESDKGRVVGIVSTLPREGKSVVAKNFASLLALQGARVVLVDGDLRQGGLSRLATPDAKVGLSDVLFGRAVTEEALVTEAETGLKILPAAVKPDFYLSAELIGSNAMATLLKSLARDYEYVIVDLPPLGPVTDAEAAAKAINAFVLVIEWGGTPRTVVRDTLAANVAVSEKTAGVLLNKVDLGALRLYQPHGLDEKQTELFNNYYR